MVVRLSASRASRPLPPGRFLVLIFVKGLVDPRAIVRLKGLGQLKNPVTSGIVPATILLNIEPWRKGDLLAHGVEVVWHFSCECTYKTASKYSQMRRRPVESCAFFFRRYWSVIISSCPWVLSSSDVTEIAAMPPKVVLCSDRKWAYLQIISIFFVSQV
jgi:hypothetical protein